MKKAARELLRDMGSDKVSSLGWRDMWAMVAVKGGMLQSCHFDFIDFSFIWLLAP